MPVGPILVHMLTASGVICAVMATLAVAEAQFEAMFLWLALALVIDGIDGPLARLLDVKARLGRFSGERLDLIVDYLTYVFVPTLAILKAGLLPSSIALTIAAAILMSSLYHFSDTDSKADDNSFVGFPAVWNLVALYLFIFTPPQALAAAVCILCVILTFVPTKWIHPVRVARWRPLTLVVLTAWFGAAGAALISGLGEAPSWAKLVLAAAAIYAVAIPWLADPQAR